MTKQEKIWVGVVLGVVVAFLLVLVAVNGAVKPGVGDQVYGMLVKKKSGENIYFPDACAIKSGEGKYDYLTWIADKKKEVYASVKNSECSGFYVCKDVPVRNKDFKFYTVTEVECKQEVASGKGK